MAAMVSSNGIFNSYGVAKKVEKLAKNEGCGENSAGKARKPPPRGKRHTL
jgi:hypothetical protein